MVFGNKDYWWKARSLDPRPDAWRGETASPSFCFVSLAFGFWAPPTFLAVILDFVSFPGYIAGSVMAPNFPGSCLGP